jgi:methoxymalonate biosynthesis protein
MTVEAGTEAATKRRARVKCVVWDLDDTLLSGVLLESADPPPPDPKLLAVLTELDARGVLNGLASRNPPESATAVRAMVGWPCEFVAAEFGWGRKSESVARIAHDLGIGVDAMAFVDDDPYERAEVAAALPDVLVLSPEDVVEALDWPQFSPAVLTDEGRRRAGAYAQRGRRLAASKTFATQEEFLRYCALRVAIAGARPEDVPRLAELAERTSRFNSTGHVLDDAQLRSLLASADHTVAAVRISDRFGDDGLVGGLVVRCDSGDWDVELLMLSCRAMGRGVVEVVLDWLVRAAAAGAAKRVHVRCRADERNVPLRFALAAAGYTAATTEGSAGGLVFDRVVDAGALPAYPDWVTVAEEPL